MTGGYVIVSPCGMDPTLWPHSNSEGKQVLLTNKHIIIQCNTHKANAVKQLTGQFNEVLHTHYFYVIGQFKMSIEGGHYSQFLVLYICLTGFIYRCCYVVSYWCRFILTLP